MLLNATDLKYIQMMMVILLLF